MITHLDHVGTAVPDLEAARQAFVRLGFRMTAISHHEGSIEPGKPVQPWGSANHCAMLHRGYLELLGITDARLFNPVEFMLAKYAGPHIVALSSDNAEATFAELAGRVDYATPPRDLGRMAPFGPTGKEMRRVAFKLVGVERGRLPEGLFQFTEHLTPEEMWQPWLLDHPNGALAVTAAHIVSSDPQASASTFVKFLNGRSEFIGAGGCRVVLNDSALVFHSRPGWEALTGRSLDKPVPAVVGIGLKVAAISATVAVLADAGIRAERSGSTLRVPAHLACGAELIFEQ